MYFCWSKNKYSSFNICELIKCKCIRICILQYLLRSYLWSRPSTIFVYIHVLCIVYIRCYIYASNFHCFLLLSYYRIWIINIIQRYTNEKNKVLISLFYFKSKLSYCNIYDRSKSFRHFRLPILLLPYNWAIKIKFLFHFDRLTEFKMHVSYCNYSEYYNKLQFSLIFYVYSVCLFRCFRNTDKHITHIPHQCFYMFYQKMSNITLQRNL